MSNANVGVNKALDPIAAASNADGMVAEMKGMELLGTSGVISLVGTAAAWRVSAVVLRLGAFCYKCYKMMDGWWHWQKAFCCWMRG